MSNYIPRSFTQELVTRCDIVDLIHTRLTLKKRGANYLACCPFHNEKTPSFTVSPAKQIYHCFGCGVSGNAISFLMAYESIEFIEAVEILANQLGIPIPYEKQVHHEAADHAQLHRLLDRITAYYHQQLMNQQNQNALAYFQQRRLQLSTIKKFNLGFAPAAWDSLQKPAANNAKLTEQLLYTGMLIRNDHGKYYDRFRNRIIFPITDRRGRIIGFGGRTMSDETPKYLNSPETPLFHKGRELYGFYHARQSIHDVNGVIIVEGYMDVLTLAQAGIGHVVATLGTAITTEHLQFLLKYTPNILFCFDGDLAGQKAAWRALETILPLAIDGIQARFALLPKEEDPDTFLNKVGVDSFKHYLAKASPLSDFFFQHLGSQVDLNTLDGKAKLSQLVNSFLQKMPTCMLKTMMQERLDRILRIKTAAPQAFKIPASTQSLNKKTTPLKKKVSLTPMRLIITLLLQHPHLVTHLADTHFLYEMEIPGKDLLLRLVKSLQENQTLATGSLLEQFRDSESYSSLVQLAHLDIPLPIENLAAEFTMLIKRLQKMHNEQKIEYFLSKANQSGLNDNEKKQLQTLIQDKQKQE